ncbi:MAG: hypothetical protein AUK35_03280 [Zetaproteobacteria bacterium CG2_30_46_52]|nr:MAG: hypothetical protein AUK35_03280 [Zetaproteobacteria bacterium CG2_30_46_52]
MIRIVFALLTIIALFIGLVMFPNIATQPVRIEMLGWLFETRTGMFVMLIVVALSVWWALKLILTLSFQSPKQLWNSLRSGNSKRREQHLQEALVAWIDEGEGNSQKLLKRSKNVIPAWLFDALSLCWNDINASLSINDEKDPPMLIALKARLATNPEHIAKLSLSDRQHYLEAWLAVHPAASLALQRKAELLGALGEFDKQAELYENLWNNKKNQAVITPLYAEALRMAAKKNNEYTLPNLRKAHRINSQSKDVIIDLAKALIASGDKKGGERMLLTYLETHDELDVAKAAFAALEKDALHNFKQIDKPIFQRSIAGSWLRVKLAHKANLQGLAEDGLNALLTQSALPEFWRMRGDWFAEKQEWQKATESYQKAISK